MSMRRSGRIHRWVRAGFLIWAAVAMAWLANTMRTRGVPGDDLRSSETVSVVETPATLEFTPRSNDGSSALIFLCGSGVAAEAYAPLLRPIAEAGHPVFVVKLPYRFAPLESHKAAAVERARALTARRSDVNQWVIAGHSLGAALASRIVLADPGRFAAMVLIGTTHPKESDLSSLAIPVTKVFASNDGVAPPERVVANRHLLPAHTQWVEVKGGNHSQFGHYGRQLFDGTATVSRERQQSVTRAALLEALQRAASATSAAVVAAAGPLPLTQRCTNPQHQFSVAYPARWYTNGGEVMPSCSAFDAAPVELPRASEIPFDIAIVVSVDAVPFAQLAAPSRWERIVSLERMPIAGRPAIRALVEATGEGLADRGMRTLRYAIDLGSGSALVASTRDASDMWEQNQQVLDTMVPTVALPSGGERP